jgi:hypothetical protein
VAYWLDEGWHNWPEIDVAGTAAAGLYARCGSYIADAQTDGFISAARARMYGTPEWIGRLVDVGLWTVEEGGFRDARYFPLNATKAEIDERKKKAAERQRRYRRKPKTGESRMSNASRDASVLAPPSPKKKGLLEPHPFEASGHAGGCCNLPESHPVHRRSTGP